ncbi:hypothetical protein [Luteolibacter soli]|uniref:Uncharacterized protein n=1 Tax=Luteolibacter soli TaxID=3135280 RepID=A0ABU9AQ87_9BACT
MKLIGLAGILALSSLACQREEAAIPPKPPASASAESTSSPVAEEKGEAPTGKATKSSKRPAVAEKKFPVAEPVADKPGFVKSPFSGSIIDVRGIPAGAMVADPMYPAEEKKHFQVPKMSPEDAAKANEEMALRELAEEDAKLNAPVAEFIPGKPGFIASPHVKPGANDGAYDKVIIDATGLEPGSVIEDPTSTPDEPRFIKVPGEAPADTR